MRKLRFGDKVRIKNNMVRGIPAGAIRTIRCLNREADPYRDLYISIFDRDDSSGVYVNGNERHLELVNKTKPKNLPTWW
jgi:hypothetical protein